MCFSAGASFVASTALAATGAVSVQRTKKYKAIALVPILFAVQQFLEGLLWITGGENSLGRLLAYGFLFFAFLVWPIYVPYAVLSAETKKKNARVLRILLYAGFAASLYLLSVLFLYPLKIVFHPHGIEYLIHIPMMAFGFVWYLLVVAGSLFVSSNNTIRHFGVLVLSSAIATYFVFTQSFISVWCFFAAALSLYIVLALHLDERKKVR